MSKEKILNLLGKYKKVCISVGYDKGLGEEPEDYKINEMEKLKTEIIEALKVSEEMM